MKSQKDRLETAESIHDIAISGYTIRVIQIDHASGLVDQGLFHRSMKIFQNYMELSEI